MPVEERLISVDELFEAAANGTLEEAMCVGTAAVICPIGELTYEGKAYTINNFQTGPLAQKLYDTLTGIQWGTQPDPHGWTARSELSRQLLCRSQNSISFYSRLPDFSGRRLRC